MLCVITPDGIMLTWKKLKYFLGFLKQFTYQNTFNDISVLGTLIIKTNKLELQHLRFDGV